MLAAIIGALAMLGLWRVCYVSYRFTRSALASMRARFRALVRRVKRTPHARKLEREEQRDTALAMAMFALAQAIQGQASQGQRK